MRISRIILAALALIWCAPAYAQFSKSTLTSQVGQQFPDNTTGAITPQILRNWLTGSLIPSFQQYAGVNAQVGTTYTIQLSDYGQLVTFNNASAVAVTLPQTISGSLTFYPFSFYAKNLGVGTVTITPGVGSLINGASSFALGAGGAAWVVSDGTNYQAINVSAFSGYGPAAAVLQPHPTQSASPTSCWQAFDPSGNDITSSLGATTTQCLQEFVTAAKASGWSWRVIGNGTIHITSQVSIPFCFLRHESIDTGVTINVDVSLGSASTILHDTYENCDISFLGSAIQHTGDTGWTYDFLPTNSDGAGGIGGFSSTVEVSSAVPATGGSGVRFSLANGSLIGNQITVHDPNGGLTGFQVTNPGSGLIAYEHNSIRILYAHGQTTRVGQIGTSATNQGNMRYNTYVFGRIDPGSGATAGWDTWEVNGTYVNLNVTNESASATTGLKVESGANNNTFIGGSLFGTTALSDSGTGNTYINVKGVSPIYAGTATNDNTSAGSIGEFISASVPTGSAVALTSGTPANVTSVSLTAGDWDCRGNVGFVQGGTTSVTLWQGVINTTSASLPTLPGNGGEFIIDHSGVPNNNPIFALSPVRFSLSGPTTAFLIADSTFTVSTQSAYGFIGCRRMR